MVMALQAESSLANSQKSAIDNSMSVRRIDFNTTSYALLVKDLKQFDLFFKITKTP